jgi:hypothetical protein
MVDMNLLGLACSEAQLSHLDDSSEENRDWSREVCSKKNCLMSDSESSEQQQTPQQASGGGGGGEGEHGTKSRRRHRRRRHDAKDKAATLTGTGTATSSSSTSTTTSTTTRSLNNSGNGSLNASSSSSSTTTLANALYSHRAIPALESFDADLQARFAKLENTAAGYSDDGWHFVCEMSGVTVTRTDQSSEPGHTCTKGIALFRSLIEQETRVFLFSFVSSVLENDFLSFSLSLVHSLFFGFLSFSFSLSHFSYLHSRCRTHSRSCHSHLRARCQCANVPRMG